MKTNCGFSKWVLPAGGLAAVIFLSAFLNKENSSGDFVAHEWGTFTGVQGGDGVPLDWRPLETSRLPKFVHDWANSGLQRQAPANQVLTKRGIITLQRMETPVIYFYSAKKQTVDVSVDFPQGLITEWYPHASQIGPSTVPLPPAVVKLDQAAHKAGIKPAFSFASVLKARNVQQSRARWKDIEVLPRNKNPELARSLPADRSGSHYFSARETDANVLQIDAPNAGHIVPEREKFIFYRGVGNFTTPLRVTMNQARTVTLLNTGLNPLVHLFVLALENKQGQFIYVPQLAPGEQKQVDLGDAAQPFALTKLTEALGQRLQDSLVSQGLYPREASAMVHTWKDSWFEEDGVRILYLLPRSWTDRILPLTLAPAPRELVRVMVGRAEVISPAMVLELSGALVRAGEGDASAQAKIVADFQKLGRFAEPALHLATQGLARTEIQTAWNLFQQASKTDGKSL